MISRSSRAGPAEAIYAGSTERLVCTETAFAADTTPETSVSDPHPEAARGGVEGRLLDLELGSRSRRDPIYSLTHSPTQLKHNSKERKKEKAAANATAAWLVDVPTVLNSSREVAA